VTAGGQMDNPVEHSGGITLADWRAQHRVGGPPKILVDPELRAFVDQLLKTDTFERIARRCLERFGVPRAPSKSAISRYWHYLQAHQAVRDGPSGAEPHDTGKGGPQRARPLQQRARCAWCHTGFQRRRTGGSDQLYCSTHCRRTCDMAARRWAAAAIASGRLSVEELRRYAGEPVQPIED